MAFLPDNDRHDDQSPRSQRPLSEMCRSPQSGEQERVRPASEVLPSHSHIQKTHTHHGRSHCQIRPCQSLSS